MMLCTVDDEICKAFAIWRWGTLFLKYSTIFLRTFSQIGEPLPIFTSERLCLSNGAFPLHGTARYGSLLGGFPLGTVPGTWYFFSTTSVEVPCEPYRYQNVTCKLCWSLIGLRKSSLLRHWTCDTRPSSTALPARFKSAQPAKDRTQLLFKQTHIFASTTK